MDSGVTRTRSAGKVWGQQNGYIRNKSLDMVPKDLHAEITGLCDVRRRDAAEISTKNGVSLRIPRSRFRASGRCWKLERAALEAAGWVLEKLRTENEGLRDLRRTGILREALCRSESSAKVPQPIP